MYKQLSVKVWDKNMSRAPVQRFSAQRFSAQRFSAQRSAAAAHPRPSTSSSFRSRRGNLS
jgi:hypothetical protein